MAKYTKFVKNFINSTTSALASIEYDLTESINNFYKIARDRKSDYEILKRKILGLDHENSEATGKLFSAMKKALQQKTKEPFETTLDKFSVELDRIKKTLEISVNDMQALWNEQKSKLYETHQRFSDKFKYNDDGHEAIVLSDADTDGNKTATSNDRLWTNLITLGRYAIMQQELQKIC